MAITSLHSIKHLVLDMQMQRIFYEVGTVCLDQINTSND
jgi:hypothetical protein